MEYFPLTIFQQSMYDMLDSLDESYSYLSFIIFFKGKVKIDFLKEAVNRVIMENDGLRIHLTKIDNEVRQYVSDYKKIDIEVCDFSQSLDPAFLSDWMRKENEKTVQLFDSDLFEFKILVFSDSSACFTKVRHVICDGWASALLKQQIEEEYSSLAENNVKQNVNRPSFIKHVRDHLEHIKSGGFEKSMEYWMYKFRPPIDATCFKPDFITSDNMKCQRIEFIVPEEIHKKLDLFCKNRFISVLTFYLSIMSVCLSKANSGNNVILGTFFHNRLTPEEQKTIGHFTTTLAMRVEIDQDGDFIKLVKQVAGELKSSIKNNYLSTRMINSLKAEAISRGLLPDEHEGNHGEGSGRSFEFHGVDTVVSYESYQNNEEIRYVMPPEEFCQLLFLITVVGKNLIFDFQYWLTAFQKSEIEQIYKGILKMTEMVVDHPGKRLAEYPFEFPGKN